MPIMSARCFEFAERAGPRPEAEAFATTGRPLDLRRRIPHARRAGNAVARRRLEGRGLPHRAGTADRASSTKAIKIDTGDRSFTVLSLPGHSFGCIGLYDERDGLLFSGDAVYDDTLIDDMWCSNRDDYRATMRRLLDLPVRIVHGGHGESFGEARLREIAREYLERPRRAWINEPLYKRRAWEIYPLLCERNSA